MTIREARPEDAPGLLRLLAASAASQGAADALCVDAATLVREGFGDRPRFHAFVAAADGDLVGLALYYFTFSTWTSVDGVYLEDLYVDPAWRRRGIARALMRRVADVAVAHRCRRFTWVVLRSNPDAIRFYEALGAHTVEDWTMMQMDATRIDRLPAER